MGWIMADAFDSLISRSATMTAITITLGHFTRYRLCPPERGITRVPFTPVADVRRRASAFAAD